MKDGYRSDCKQCDLAAKAARHAANPQLNRDRVKKRQQQNNERYRARQRDYERRPERKSWNASIT